MITIDFHQPNAVFCPGDLIAGIVQWVDLPTTGDRIEIRLIWYTTGKGSQDFETVAKTSFTTPGSDGQKEFEFVAPGRPCSFSGTLISLIWAIEVIVFPEQEAEQKSLVLSPLGQEVVLAPIAEISLKKRFFEVQKNR